LVEKVQVYQKVQIKNLTEKCLKNYPIVFLWASGDSDVFVYIYNPQNVSSQIVDNALIAHNFSLIFELFCQLSINYTQLCNPDNKSVEIHVR